MSAYVVVEATIRNREAQDRYGTQANAVLKQFGADVITFGPWRTRGCGSQILDSIR